MSKSITLNTPFHWCRTEFDVSTTKTDGADFAIQIRTGAAWLQTYATRDELRALGEMLLRRADANEVLEVSA